MSAAGNITIIDRSVKLTGSVVIGIFTQISLFFTYYFENVIWKCNSYRYKKSQKTSEICTNRIISLHIKV